MLNFINFLNNKLVAVHDMFGFLISFSVFDVVQINLFCTISIAVEQAIEIEPVFTILDDIVFLFFFNFLNQHRADVFPPF
jgi:hypothetical protein